MTRSSNIAVANGTGESPLEAPVRYNAMAVQAVPRQTFPMWPAVVMTYLLFLPTEVEFTLGTWVLFPYRTFLICCLPLIFREIVNNRVKLGYVDIIVGAMLYWILFALIITEGFAKAIANGGASVIDIGLAYFLARCTLTSSDHVDRFLRAVAPGYLIAGCSIVVETVSGQYIIRPLFAKIFGSTGPNNLLILTSARLGLLRGNGPFAHPILGGLQLASLLPLYVFSRLPQATRIMGIVAALLSIATLSSSAVLSLIIAVMLIAYEYGTVITSTLTWRRMLYTLFIMVFVLQIFTKGGVMGIVVNFLTFDKWTAYYRMLIWQYGSITVIKHPWVGIGFEDWERPSWMAPSIDNYWLYIAINYGIPEALARFFIPIFAAALASVAMIGHAVRDRRAVLGFTIAISILTLMGFTVSYWGVTQTWYFFLLGGAVALPRAIQNQIPVTQ